MKHLLLIITMLFSTRGFAESRVKLFKKIKEDTVLITRKKTAPFVDGAGSGIVIGEQGKFNLILTNAHVCGPKEVAPVQLLIYTSDMKPMEGIQLMSVPPVDLCIILVPKFKTSNVKISDKEFPIGTEGYNFNYGSSSVIGARGNVLSGFIGEIRGFDRMFGAVISPGASGSGVFDEDMNLLGVIYMAVPGTNSSVIIDVSIINALLQQIESQLLQFEQVK